MDQSSAPLPVVTLGAHVLDERNARLTLDGVPLEIPPKAFSVLCHLARNAQRLITKDELLDAVWGHRHVSESVLKTTINQLRSLLGDDPRAPRYIETANRRGYRFVATVAPMTAPGPAPAATPSATSPGIDRTPVILAVDDEPELVSMLADYLGARGFRVLTAGSAAEARTVLGGGTKIAMVLLDITMPGEDGLSLARHLREHAGPPVILLSALATMTDKIVGLEVGADDYVTKPFEMRELLARIKNVLRRSGA